MRNSARLTEAVTTVDPEERRKIEMDRMRERQRKKELIQERKNIVIKFHFEPFPSEICSAQVD